MNPSTTIENLRQLKLSSFASSYEKQLAQPSYTKISFDERLYMLVEQEINHRENKRINLLLKNSKFSQKAYLEDFVVKGDRGINADLIRSFASCDWIERKQHIILSGPTGVGKSWLACAIGASACRLKIPTLFITAKQLFEDIRVAFLDGSIPKLRTRLIKPRLLIIDDFGLSTMDYESCHLMLEVIDARREVGSLIFTSQFDVGDWHARIPSPTLADSILDRVIHRSHILQLKGESMRKLMSDI